MVQQVGTTSGTYAWQLDIADILEEAYELAGVEMKSGYAAESGRRSLNLLFTSWINKGINLWTLELKTLDLVDGTTSYTLDSATSDIYSMVLRQDGIDTEMTRLGLDEYLKLPDKTSEGIPTHFATERRRDRIVLYLYPTPNASTLDLVYYRIRYIQDIGGSAEIPDAPRRFLPALITGLAYQLALKAPQLDGPRLQMLKMEYNESMTAAIEEDREKSSLFLVPN